MTNKPKLLLLGTSIVAAMLLTACSGGEDAKTDSQDNSSTSITPPAMDATVDDGVKKPIVPYDYKPHALTDEDITIWGEYKNSEGKTHQLRLSDNRQVLLVNEEESSYSQEFFAGFGLKIPSDPSKASKSDPYGLIKQAQDEFIGLLKTSIAADLPNAEINHIGEKQVSNAQSPVSVVSFSVNLPQDGEKPIDTASIERVMTTMSDVRRSMLVGIDDKLTDKELFNIRMERPYSYDLRVDVATWRNGDQVLAWVTTYNQDNEEFMNTKFGDFIEAKKLTSSDFTDADHVR